MKRKAEIQEAPLSYQELSAKILPELHLLAQEAGIEG
jgi:transcription termination factor Rho